MQLRKIAPYMALITVASLALLPFASATVVDPTYFVNCTTPSTPTLSLTLPSAGQCSSTTSIVADGPAGSSYSPAPGSIVTIYVYGAVAGVSATYSLVDTSIAGSPVVASGSVSSSSSTDNGCRIGNTLTGSGTTNPSVVVSPTDVLQLTLTFSKAVTVCTGGETPTSVSFGGVSPTLPPPGVPQFPFGMALLMALAVPALLLVRSKSVRSA
jgi:hypothetical protein